MQTFRRGVKADAEMIGWSREKKNVPGFAEQEPACLGKLREAGEVARTME